MGTLLAPRPVLQGYCRCGRTGFILRATCSYPSHDLLGIRLNLRVDSNIINEKRCKPHDILESFAGPSTCGEVRYFKRRSDSIECGEKLLVSTGARPRLPSKK